MMSYKQYRESNGKQAGKENKIAYKKGQHEAGLLLSYRMLAHYFAFKRSLIRAALPERSRR